MHRRAPSYSLARGLALAAVILALPACEKPSSGTTDPDTAGGGTKKGGGMEFAYADSFALDGEISVEFSNESPEGKGTAKIVAKTRIDAAPAGDKSKLHGKVVELVEYTGTGTLDVAFMKEQMAKQGQADFDLVASLASSEEWMVIDARGELDDEATKALPENASEDKGMGGGDFGLFNLPDLPKVALEVGKETKLPTQEKEENMFGQSIPMEVDQTWTLVALADEGGRQVARFKVTSESSGATEIQGQGGGGMLAVGQEANFEITFDVAAKLPISLAGESMFELAFDGGGQSIGFSTQSKIHATYTAAK